MINFKLKFIRTDEFATIKENLISESKVRVGNSFNFLINTSSKEVILSHHLTFESDNKAFIILKISCGFLIKPDDFEGFKKPNPNKIEIPANFLTHLISITTGTARGILHCKLEGTEFSKYMLPMVDLSKALNKPLIINLLKTEQKDKAS